MKMEYTINQMAKLAGVTRRTLRYYHQCGLLKPLRIDSNGYRIYGKDEVDRLQLIMFYREMEMPLEEIGKIINSKNFDCIAALEGHLKSLVEKRERLDKLIDTARKTIKAMKGETIMKDREKFNGFLKKTVEENEEKYGTEIRQKYGDKAVEESNKRLLNKTPEEYAELEKLTAEFHKTLKEAFEEGNPAGEKALRAAELHKKWLMFYWKEYSEEAHMGLTQMYIDDSRFTEYFDKIVPGCALFLRDAVANYCMKEV